MGAELGDDVDVERGVGDRWSPAEGPLGDLIRLVGRWIRFVGLGRIVSALGAALVIAGVAWWLLRAPDASTESRLPLAKAGAVGATTGERVSGPPTTSVAGPTTAVERFMVHVTGAVRTPGVYELEAGQRVADAIVAAGGALADGDADALNLAAPIADGDRIAVPSAGESAGRDELDAGHTHAARTSADADEPVDINVANADQLEVLPGIGPATAAAIVDHRVTNGPYATVDDLEAVRGIGPAKIEAIRDFVTV